MASYLYSLNKRKVACLPVPSTIPVFFKNPFKGSANMKKANGLKRTMLIYFLSIGFTALLSTQAFGQVIKITINQLLESLDNPQLLILDVRTTGSWQGSNNKIKGAVRKNPDIFDSWANDLPKNKYPVLY